MARSTAPRWGMGPSGPLEWQRHVPRDFHEPKGQHHQSGGMTWEISHGLGQNHRHQSQGSDQPLEIPAEREEGDLSRLHHRTELEEESPPGLSNAEASNSRTRPQPSPTKRSQWVLNERMFVRHVPLCLALFWALDGDEHS